MKTRLIAFFSSSFLLLCQYSIAGNSKLQVGKEPSWVTLHSATSNSSELESQADDGIIDLEFEEQVSLATQSTYIKKVKKILSEAGVQNGSEISINFDPSYEQLILHKLRIIRDGKSINKLNLSAFKVIQQEKELDRYLYDGTLTALLILDDVRKGDIIELSYTIKGFNPIFNDVYAEDFNCNYSVPVCHLYYKLLVPKGRNIEIKNRNVRTSPVTTVQDDQTIYEWTFDSVPALTVEDKTPDWYDPYGSIMISEYKNWNEVNKWCAALFPLNQPLSPGLRKKINDIKMSYPDENGRILAALHFVQDEIRYMAIEIGVNTHKPNQPDKVFKQRFGDCKDKSYLLVTMLNEMGITAKPVLINSDAGQTLSEKLPSPLVFDHCTVQVKTHDNKTYWFDPTISFQRGPIDSITYPDYKMGLVINGDTEGLTEIPLHDHGLSDIKEIFTINNSPGSTKLKVVTVNSGWFADDSRDEFNNNSISTISNHYKDFYAYYFDKITADSITYNDDSITGNFTITEYYTIDDIWEKENGDTKIDLSSFVIDDVLRKPVNENRKMPYRMSFPAHYKEELEMNMPEAWPIKSFQENANCSNFILNESGSSSGNKVTLKYEYKSLKDNVSPPEIPQFVASYNFADKKMGYQLYYDKTSGTRSNLTSYDRTESQDIFPKLYTALGICVVITIIVKNKKKRRNKNY